MFLDPYRLLFEQFWWDFQKESIRLEWGKDGKEGQRAGGLRTLALAPAWVQGGRCEGPLPGRSPMITEVESEQEREFPKTPSFKKHLRPKPAQ